MTIQDRFPNISDPFSFHFRPFPDHFRPLPDHFRPFRKSSDQVRQFPGLLSTNSRSSDTISHTGAAQQGTARPPKQEHRPNRPRPLTGGTTWGHRVKTQEKVIDNSNTHTTPTFPGRFPTTFQRSPFLNFRTVSSLFPTISFTFRTNSHPTTDHFTTISDHFLTLQTHF